MKKFIARFRRLCATRTGTASQLLCSLLFGRVPSSQDEPGSPLR